jgi:hypothetical protein
MKKYILISFLSACLFLSCKPKKEATATASSDSTSSAAQISSSATGTTMGTVSHKYKATGCSTVIIVKQEEGDDLTLIPKDKLAKEYDMDGMILMFNYHTLRMPQPEGCTTGIPAEITDVSKK